MLFELARVWLKILLRGSPDMPKKKYIVNLNDAERAQAMVETAVAYSDCQ